MSTDTRLEAGPELDAEIARRVMGWIPVGVPGGVWWYGGERPGVIGPPPYSTKIAAAWQVVEHYMADKPHPWITLQSDNHGHWLADFHRGGTYEQCSVWSDTAPLAICRAALAAVAEGDTDG